MLRTADKRLFVSAQLQDVFGGRLGAFPYAIPGHMEGPVPPVSGYTGWWDISNLDSVIVANGVLCLWMDLSGSGFHLSRAVATGPTYGARTINGIVVPDFTPGSLHHLVCGEPRDDRTSCTFVVAETDTIGAGVRTMIGANGTGGLHFRQSANELQTSTSATLMAQLDNVIVANDPYVAVQNLTATDVTQYYNATSETDANATILTGGRTMEVGRNAVNGEYWDGAFAEIIYYPFTLTGGEVTSVISYLNAKWGTP